MSTRREALERDRDILATAIETCESNRDLAGLIREHRAVMAELDALPVPNEVSNADEIAARRSARRAGSSGSPRSQRSS